MPASIVAADPAERHRLVAGAFTEHVLATRDWTAPAPVPGWLARDVVAHLVDWFPGFLASGSGVELAPGPPVTDDPVGAWRAQVDGIQAVLNDPASAERAFTNVHTGTLPLPDAIDRFYTADVFMHTWDLARANGAAARLDEPFCAVLLGGMEPIEELMRGSGQYGPRVPVAPDATVEDRLVAFIGRDPAWTPPSSG